MPKFRAIGKSVNPPVAGIATEGLVVTVDFAQIDADMPPRVVETRTLTATTRADLKAQVQAILQTMRDRYRHAKHTADIVGQMLDEVQA